MNEREAKLRAGIDGAGSSRHGGSRERRLTLALACTCFLFFLPFQHNHFKGSDEIGIFETTRSLFENASLAVPPIRHTEIGRDGQRYSYFAVGQSVLAIPFYALGKLARVALPEAWGRTLAGPEQRRGPYVFGGQLEISAVLLYPPLMCALLVTLFFRFERRLGVSLPHALLASALLASGTYTLLMSAYFLRHGSEATAVLGAFYFYHRWRNEGRSRDLWIGSLLASSLILIRVPAGLAAPALAGYLAWLLYERFRDGETPRDLLPALAAILIPLACALALHALVNQIKWESFFGGPMVGQHSRFQTPIWVGLAGLLVSPGSSVFLYSPPILLTPLAWIAFVREHRAEALAYLGLALCFLLVFAKFDGWSGLWSAPGPRYLFLPIPLLMLPLGLWLDRRPGRGKYLAVGVLGVLGFAVQLVSLSVRWGMVPGLAKYPLLDPDQSGFLFELERSPLLVMARLLSQGGPIDLWLWRLYGGTETMVPQPGSALLLLALWALCFGGALFYLRRELAACLSQPVRGSNPSAQPETP